MTPHNKSNETYKLVKEVLPKTTILDEKLKYFYKFIVLHESPADLNECIWMLRVGDANQVEHVYTFTNPIDEVFKIFNQLSEGEQKFLRIAVSYWLKQRLHKPHFEMLVKVGDVENYNSEQYEKLGKTMVMLDFDKSMKKNEYYYELPEFFSFLFDEKYRDSKLDTVIRKFFTCFEEHVLHPSEFIPSDSQDSWWFSSYYIDLFKELMCSKIPFFRIERLKWTKKFNRFIEKTVIELESMIKSCKPNSEGKLMYNSIEIDDLDSSMYFIYYFWKILAPFKFANHIESKVNETFWAKRYCEYFDEQFSILEDLNFFLYYKDLYFRPYFTYADHISESRPYEPKYKEVLWNIIRNRHVDDLVEDFKKADWEKFFEITK